MPSFNIASGSTDTSLHEGAATALELRRAGQLVHRERAPWKLAKDESRADELDDTLGSLV